MSVSAVEAEDLTKAYGDILAVEGINLQINKGEIFGLIGPNGSGKTTTVKILSTLLPPTRGYAKILGYVLGKEDRKIRERIGVVQQVESYESNLTVERSLDVYGMLWNIPRKERRAKVNEVLAAFDLSSYRTKRVSELSVGLRRRLQVAREFLHEFELLFLDEPTVGLDPLAKRSLLRMLKSRTQKGLTVLLTTNMLDEAEYLCSRIAILNGGRLGIIGTPAELKARYGGFKTVEVYVTAGDINALAKSLSNYAEPGSVSVSEDSTIKIYTKDPESTFAEVLKAADKMQITLGSVSIKEPTLEQWINFKHSSIWN
ncbi:MAG: ABC transporter ATP-binding protein [Conexivisphaerales archaeon]